MSVYLSPLFGAGVQLFSNSNSVLSGGKLFTYQAGTTTNQATFTTIAGSIQNANPIILDANGRIPNEIWLTGGVAYKFTLTDSLGNQLGTWDNITGVNDPTLVQSEWIPSGFVPAYVSASQFSVTGNALNVFVVNRRVQVFVTAGTLYGYISASSFAGGFTTVTVVFDSGAFDNGLSVVNVALLNGTNQSIPSALTLNSLSVTTASATTLTTTTQALGNSSTNAATTAFVQANQDNKIQPVTASVATNALTVGLNPTLLDFRSTTLTTGVPNTRIVPASISCTVASGATLGTTNGVAARLMLLAIDNVGTVEMAIVNLIGAPNLDETTLISTTALSVTSNSATVIYSTASRTNVPFRVVGYIDITEATAGTWATAPTTVQGTGGQSLIRSPIQSMVRLNTANGYGSTNTVIPRFTNVVINQGSDIIYTDSATLGASFTIVTSGIYGISVTGASSTGGLEVGLSLNSTQLTTAASAINAADRLSISAAPAGYFITTGVPAYLPAGSVIRPHFNAVTAGTLSAQWHFTITRIN